MGVASSITRLQNEDLNNSDRNRPQRGPSCPRNPGFVQNLSWIRVILESEKKNTHEKTSFNWFCYVIFCWNQYFYQIIEVLLWYCSVNSFFTFIQTDPLSAKKFSPQNGSCKIALKFYSHEIIKILGLKFTCEVNRF